MARAARLSPRARRWLLRELAYLLSLNPTAARNLSARMREARQRLSDFPDRGTPGRVAFTRRLVVGPYILIYRKLGDKVEITDIRHGRQRDSEEPVSSTADEIEDC